MRTCSMYRPSGLDTSHPVPRAVPVALVTMVSLTVALMGPAQAAPAPGQDSARQEQESNETGLRAVAVKMGQDGLVAPMLVDKTLPEYTPAAQSAGIEGDVYIEAVVTDEGEVAEPKLVRGVGDDALDQAALDAILSWSFEPGTLDGEPVHVLALFSVTYRIE